MVDTSFMRQNPNCSVTLKLDKVVEIRFTKKDLHKTLSN